MQVMHAVVAVVCTLIGLQVRWRWERRKIRRLVATASQPASDLLAWGCQAGPTPAILELEDAQYKHLVLFSILLNFDQVRRGDRGILLLLLLLEHCESSSSTNTVLRLDIDLDLDPDLITLVSPSAVCFSVKDHT